MTKEELFAGVAKAVEEASKIGLADTAKRIEELMTTHLTARFGPSVIVPSYKSLAEQLAAQEDFKGLAAIAGVKGGRVNAGPWPVQMERYGLKEGEYSAPAIKANVLSTGFPSERSYLPFVRPPQRRLYMRDVLPVQGLGTPQLEYARISAWANSAVGVAEAAAKPESEFTTQVKLESVKQIATFIPVSRRALRDVAGLAAYINQILAFFMALEEDNQILNGAGGSDMNGILNDADIQTRAVGADTKLDAIRKAITDLQVAMGTGTDVVGFEPSAIVLHPKDWLDLELLKDTTGRYLLIPAQETPAEGGPQPARVWRVPIVVSPAIAENTGLLGAFDIGATLWTYDDVSVRMSDSHSDFFIKNLVAVLAEFRELLAIYFPKAFIKITGL